MILRAIITPSAVQLAAGWPMFLDLECPSNVIVVIFPAPDRITSWAQLDHFSMLPMRISSDSSCTCNRDGHVELAADSCYVRMNKRRNTCPHARKRSA
jgi:hypothetical protein